MDDTSLALSMAEWQAWRNMCSELDRLNINLNDHDKLTEAIRLWGDQFVELKVYNRFTRQT